MNARCTVKIEFTEDELASLIAALPDGVELKYFVHLIVMYWLDNHSVAKGKPDENE